MKMRRQDRVTSKSVSWRKWILYFVSLLFIFMTGYSIYLYNYVMTTKQEGFLNSQERVLRETDLIEVSNIERFNGDEPYHIVYAKTEQHDSEIVFVPLNKNKKLKRVKEDKIIPKSKMIERFNSSCDSCKLIKITPAILNNKLLWEITYIDRSNRYVFDYRSIDDGEVFEQFKMISNFD